MTKIRGNSRPSALPYTHKPKVPLPPPPSPPKPPRSRKGIYIASFLFIYATSTYTVYLYRTLLAPPDPSKPLPEQDTDLSSRYNETASTFDENVSFLETTTGINKLRKKIVGQASGDVLEISCGTGRNCTYYDLGKVRSLVFVDQSAEMIEIAKSKWRLLHPNYAHATFLVQDAADPLPQDVVPRGGFDTVVQTMGVCSCADPSAVLKRVGGYVKKKSDGEEGGKVLLVEHGRSGWKWVDWVLDRAAGRHAVVHGCWPNRDVGGVFAAAGLRVESVVKRGFGTVWGVVGRLGEGEEAEMGGVDDGGVD